MEISGTLDSFVVKTECSSPIFEHGVTTNLTGDLVCTDNTVVSQSRLSLKDELRFKILERRKQEGKSEIMLPKEPEPKEFPLTKEELVNREKRKANNRIAARKCRLKQRRSLEQNSKLFRELRKRRQDLIKSISELEEEIQDIRCLWRLISRPSSTLAGRPGASIGLVKTEPDNTTGVSTKLETSAPIGEIKPGVLCYQTSCASSVQYKDQNESQKIVLKRCGIALVLPATMQRQFQDRVNLRQPGLYDQERNGRETMSHDSCYQHKTTFDFPFNDGGICLKSVPVSPSHSEISDFEGYEEMKPDEFQVSSANDSTSGCPEESGDSDVELIELGEGKLLIDLTA